jgi:hypothetical protein
VDVVPEGVLVCGALEPLVAVEPVIDGLVVLTAPALPVVPVAEGEVCVADGVVCVADGLPLVAPPGAAVVELVPVCVPDVPAVPVVWAVATPMASVNANAVRNPLFIVSLKPARWGLWFVFLYLNQLDANTDCQNRRHGQNYQN